MDGSRIQQITPEGLLYADDDGTEQFLSFAQCYENNMAFRTSPEYWQQFKEVNNLLDHDFDEYLSTMMEFKEVGIRQPLSPPWDDGPYIEFYTQPRLRFNFGSHELYYQVLEEIGNFGWRTFDLS